MHGDEYTDQNPDLRSKVSNKKQQHNGTQKRTLNATQTEETNKGNNAGNQVKQNKE